MLFNSAEFVAFYAATFLLYFLVTSDRRLRLWILTIASLAFYASFDWRYAPLLLGTSLFDFYIGRAIGRYPVKRAARPLLVLSLVVNLGVLVFFKYTNFFLASLAVASQHLGVGFAAPMLRIALPLGISFYTFQSLSYTIDVYLERFETKTDLLEFVSSFTFFPHLLAGPIVRSSTLLPQFRTLTAPERSAVLRGFLLIGLGAMKKTIADLIAPGVDAMFAAAKAGPLDALSAWGGIISFLAQMYGDFSGYTDMATGLAALLGFTLPANFNLPYIASSPADFWRRWHISLSSWFRDYLYFPLAFGWLKGRPNANTFTVMLVTGIWHGASWNMVLFGLYHASVMLATLWLGKKWKAGSRYAETAVGRIGCIAFTVWSTCNAQVIFRADSWTMMRNVFRAMYAPTIACAAPDVGWKVLGLGVLAVVSTHVIDWLFIHRRGGVGRAPVVWAAVVFSLGFSIAFAGNGKAFIYFQF